MGGSGLHIELTTLGFSPAYECQASPEFPGTGEWGHPTFHFVRRPADLPRATRLGTPLALRLRRDDEFTWVGFFTGGVVGLTGLYACPNASQLCVVLEGLGYLVETAVPANYRVLPIEPVKRIERHPQEPMMLAAGYFDLLAIDNRGLLWRSDRLCLDDLAIESFGGSTIICTGRSLEGDRKEFVLGADTGLIVSGPRFQDVGNRRYWHRDQPQRDHVQ